MSAPLRVLLGDISESVDYGVTASAADNPVGPKFLRITDIQDGRVDWSLVPWCECPSREVGQSALKPGDIVFARTGATTGKSFLIRECPDNAVFASYLIRVRLGKRANPSYVSHFFHSRDYWSQITKVARGAAQPGVNATTLRSLEIPFPLIPEQRRIAAILDNAEALRSKRRAALARLDTLAQSIFIEMFGDPATNLSGFPIKRVGELADVQGGLQVTTARKDHPIEVPYLRVANVYREYLNLTEVKTIRATSAEIARTILKKGDLLIVEGHGNPEEIGRSAIWDGSVEPCIHQNHIIRARFDHQTMSPLFACTYLNSPAGRRHLLRAGKTTSGLNTISVSEVRGTPIAMPPLALQDVFCLRMEKLAKLKDTQETSLAALDALFRVIQDRAFRGEL